MPIRFVLLVNKQGQTRLAKYTDQSMSVEERRALEGEIVRKCLTRAEKQVAFSSPPGGALGRRPLPCTECLAVRSVFLRGAPKLQGRVPAIRVPLLPGRH